MKLLARHNLLRYQPFLTGLMVLLCGLILSACGGGGSGGSGAGGSGTDSSNSNGGFSPAPNQAVIYYKRSDGDYEGWGVHLWGANGSTFSVNSYIGNNGETAWTNPLPPIGIDETFGAYFVVDFNGTGWSGFNFIVHKGDEKDLGGQDHIYSKSDFGSDVYSFSGVASLFANPLTAPPVTLEGASAHWLSTNTLVMNVPSGSTMVKLYYSETAGMSVDGTLGEVHGGEAIVLTQASLTDELKARFPHLANYSAWNLPDSLPTKSLLKGQLIAASFDSSEQLTKATKVQIQGVIDAVYAEQAESVELGATTTDVTRFRVWAPTAQSISVKIYNDRKQLVGEYPMTEDSDTGVWGYDSTEDERGHYYRYEVKVFHYLTDNIEILETTDPYSLSLSTNSEYSQVVRLTDENLKPAGWDDSDAAYDFEVSAPEDIVIYETHIRDFSMQDRNGDLSLSGKFLAFTDADRESVQHLKSLHEAGLTHVHLLPAFDFATVDEKATNRIDLTNTKGELCAIRSWASLCANASVSNPQSIESALEACDPSTGCAQAIMSDIRDLDSFNWGYDPYHYTVPEGSYASDPEGTTRIIEFRKMVEAIHAMGLNVVMDVVYNHTNASGVGDKSVLDKLVPGYYHRLNPESGAVEKSTCCENTATESRMFQKLMEDSLVVWARDYKVDGFRFDIMGHHPKQGILDALAKVKAVRPHAYFYGEGWNFGEVANDARFEQAVQANMAGTEVGTFSDRVRDAIRGGGPFDGGESLRQRQGFANGLYVLPNELNSGADSEKQALLHLTDLIRLSLAGNLHSFVLKDYQDRILTGSQFDYVGQKAGYAKDPADMINYISKHDNQTLWDNNMYKVASSVNTANRVRMQIVGLSVPLLSQGIPFLHMGSDLLRSKSMQRDSYDSGDWFNSVDFSKNSNNWNVGLPRQDKDGGNWPVITPLLQDDQAKPSDTNIANATIVFQDFLRIRSQSPLFHLRTAEQIEQRVDFHNTGSEQIPGVIVMSVDDGSGLEDLDSQYDAVLVVVNATPQAQSLSMPAIPQGFELINVQQSGQDAAVRQARVSGQAFEVPAFTTAVFVKPQGASQGPGIPVSDKTVSEAAPFGSATIYVRGTMNGWGTDTEMNYVGNGIYQSSIALAAGSYEFKIADANWQTVNFGSEVNAHPGEAQPLEYNGANIVLELDSDKTILFSMDASQPESPILRLQ